MNKERVKVEKILFPFVYMVLYRTKIGLHSMDRIAKKYPRVINVFSILGIVVGFIGMMVILVLLVKGIYGFLFSGAPPPVAPLFPGIKTVPGVPVISFFHWIIAIFILAIVHEFSHGLVARRYDIKVKSSGFAVFSLGLPVIPAAFVEPDEKELASKSKKEQLGVLAAGSFSNLISALVFLLIFSFLLVPVFSSTIHREGVIVAGVYENYPANLSGVTVGEEIIKVNNFNVNNVDDFLTSVKAVAPGDQVDLVTNKSSYLITAIDPPKTFSQKLMFWKENRGFIGIIPGSSVSDYKDGMNVIGGVLSWLVILFFWIFVANLGVGLFNLLPMGPLDGGKMFYLLCLSLFKNENQAKKVWIAVSFFCLALIFISLAPFLWRLFNYLFNLIAALF
ncbi:MAG: site-2 protease family protein [Nanoarchaeota archaeon]